MGDRVADRSLQPRSVELLLDQVVGHPERGGGEIDLVVALPGEHDHRRVGRGGERLGQQVQAGPFAEPVVDQVDVVAALPNRDQRI